jgi:hypothetical protein
MTSRQLSPFRKASTHTIDANDIFEDQQLIDLVVKHGNSNSRFWISISSDCTRRPSIVARVPGIPAPLHGWPDIQLSIHDGLFRAEFCMRMPATDDIIFTDAGPISALIGHPSVMPEIWKSYMQSITLVNRMYSIAKGDGYDDPCEINLVEFGDPVDVSVLGSEHAVVCYGMYSGQEPAFRRFLAAIPGLKETARGQIWQSEQRLVLRPPFGFHMNINSTFDGVEWNGVYYNAICEYDNGEFFQGWFYQAREWVLALEPLNLPGYVLLWILQEYRRELWLVERGIIDMITSVIKSCRNVRAKRLVSASAAAKTEIKLV